VPTTIYFGYMAKKAARGSAAGIMRATLIN
jgi:hypothetical protein